MNVEKPSSALGELLFLTGSRKGQTFQITKERLSIGRQADPTNDLILSEASISRHHAMITCENGIWHVSKLSANNTLFIDKQEVRESSIICNRNVIQLGTDVELLFLSYVLETLVDSGTAPTLYRSLLQANAGVSQEKQISSASDNPLKNPGHSVWQVVSIFTTLSGVIVAAIPLDLFQKIGQIMIAVITILLCVVLIQRARRKPGMPALQEKPQRKLGAIRSLRPSLWINMALTLVGVLTMSFTLLFYLRDVFSAFSGDSVNQTPLTVLVVSLILLAGGMLISFLILVVQVFRLLRKKLLTGAGALGRSAAAFGITLAITFALYLGAGFLNNLASGLTSFVVGLLIIIGTSTLLLCFESLLMFLILGIRTLITLSLRHLSAVPGKVFSW